jgi:hypothetical protein
MALRGPTSTRPGYKVPTPPVKEDVKVDTRTEPKSKKPKKRKGLFTK